MDKKKIEKLKERGWNVGDAADFLGLTNEEEAYIELKIILAEYLQEKRTEKRLTQNQLASLIKSSQSRVAKMEKNDPTVSLDLMVRSLFALGTSKHEIARAISVKKRRPIQQLKKTDTMAQEDISHFPIPPNSYHGCLMVTVQPSKLTLAG
jgi:transcriptional regulator with XRE-family HTH domain